MSAQLKRDGLMDFERLPGFLGISHIALVVPDLEKAWEQFKFFGYLERGDGTVEVAEFGTQALVISNNDITVELITPLNNPEESQYAEQLRQKRYCMDHICYRVRDLDSAVAALRSKRFMTISQPRISPVWGKRTLLLANRKMGTIELLEED